MAYSRSFLRHTSLLVLAIAAAAACSDGTKPPGYIEPNTNVPRGDGDGDGDGDKGTGGTEGEAVVAPEPKIEISFEGGTPDLDNPARGSISVVCQATPGDETEAAAINKATVTLRLLDQDGEEVESFAGSAIEDSDDEFSAEFILENLKGGEYAGECDASTIGKTASTGSGNIKFLLDAGPTIAILSPAGGNALASKSPQTFEFEVKPAPLSDKDPGAAVETVTVTVRGVEYAATLIPNTTNQYRVEIDFTDTTKFPTLPDGDTSLMIRATNSRGDNSQTSSLQVIYALDGKGPELTLVSPKDLSILSGTVSLTFSAVDDFSGTDLNSLSVRINEVPHVYDADTGAWTLDGTRVTFKFDSDDITGSIAQMNVSITGADNVGNPANIRTATFYWDEQAPIVSLTPPLFRASRRANNEDYCSHAFYPTGTATRGGEVEDAVTLRAVVWDETNQAPGQDVLFYSLVDRNRTELWVRRADGPIIADTNADGVCDDVVSTAGVSVSKQLAAITPTGSAYFGDGTGDVSIPSMTPPGGGFCNYQDSAPPKQLCTGEVSDLTTVARHNIAGTAEPIIYGLPSSSGLQCTGGQWELPSALPGYQGWVCVAARAYDNAGNRGVSAPIALCLDSSLAGEPACVNTLGSPPDCAAGCSLPKDFPADGVVYRQ